jgi:hypothetical protein
VPGELCEIIHITLAKEPEGRFPAYDRLIDSLKRFQLTMVAKEQGIDPAEGKRLKVEGAPDKPEPKLTPLQPSGPAATTATEKAQSESDERPQLPPIAEPELTARRALLIMFGALLILIAILTVVFMRQRESVAGENQNFFMAILSSILSPKSKEEKLSGDELYLYQCQTTIDRMQDLWEDIRTYTAEKGDTPESLQELVDADYITSEQTVDAWGREIIYIRMNGDLRSFGEDGIEDSTDDIKLNTDGRFYSMPERYNQIKLKR